MSWKAGRAIFASSLPTTSFCINWVHHRANGACDPSHRQEKEDTASHLQQSFAFIQEGCPLDDTGAELSVLPTLLVHTLLRPTDSAAHR